MEVINIRNAKKKVILKGVYYQDINDVTIDREYLDPQRPCVTRIRDVTDFAD